MKEEETFMDITGDAIAGTADAMAKLLMFLFIPVGLLVGPGIFTYFALGSSGKVADPTNHWIGDVIVILATVTISLFYYMVILGEFRRVIAYRAGSLASHVLITAVAYGVLYFKFDAQPDWRAWIVFALTFLCYVVTLRTDTQDANV